MDLNRKWGVVSPSIRTALTVAIDGLIVMLSALLAYQARFEGSIPQVFGRYMGLMILATCAVYITLLATFSVYRVILRYTSIDTLMRIGTAVLFGTTLCMVAALATRQPSGVRYVPVSVIMVQSVVVLVLFSGLRVAGRLFRHALAARRSGGLRRVLVVGAGDTGLLFLRDVRNLPSSDIDVLGFVDDDNSLRGRLIGGVAVLGSTDAIPELVERLRATEIVIAVTTLNGAEKRRILQLCMQAQVPARMIRGLATGGQGAGVADLEPVRIEDLLGREPIVLDADAMGSTLTDRIVLVTGAAGSIGSELCRQICRSNPTELHLLEIDETRLYELYLELEGLRPGIAVMHVCDIRDDRKVAALFRSIQPQVVLHAAAYKHVPLMEIEPDEAVKTNIIGTKNVLEACLSVNCERFVLISTDKAVSPSSVMGATKAVAELLMLEYARRGLRACAVRFGNVLGSRGSVVPLFEVQLASGGPLRITHPEATRFFMTIPEAAQLVLQAQAMSESADVFVLEMGEPVRILDLARAMIALTGVSAEIEYIGLRPAEKIHEVLTHPGEELVVTETPRIRRLNALPMPSADFAAKIAAAAVMARLDDPAGVVGALRALLPAFTGQAVDLTAAGPSADMRDPDLDTLF